MKTSHAAGYLLSAALVALLCAGASGQTAWWDGDYAARRAVTVYAGDAGVPGDEAAIVTFETAGMAAKDGADIRVVARGREVPCRLYGVGPGDTATLAFKVTKEVRDYHIYFANPKAKAPSGGWSPARGLILETRKFNGGDPSNLARMRQIWAASGPFYGAGAVERVWHGYNPFGPNEGFVSRYEGWFVCRVKGTYDFATTSDDASFLVVDGRQIAAWPGWHGPVGDARHHGTAVLDAGVHRLEYLHATGGGTTCAVAAWRAPGADGFEVMPASVFVPLSRAVVGPLELASRRTAADFSWQSAGEALLSKEEERYAVRMSFQLRTEGAQTGAVLWDFGDGQKGRGPAVSHLFLAEGDYNVTMSLGQGANAPSVKNAVRVHRGWERQAAKEIDQIASYMPEVAKYDIEALDAGSAYNLIIIAREGKSAPLARRVALAVAARANDAGPGRLRSVLDAAREAIGIEGLSKDDALIKGYLAGQKAAKGEAKAVLAQALVDIYLEKGDADAAAAVAKETLSEEMDRNAKRLLYIAYAQAAGYRGDGQAAANALAAAAEIGIDRSSLQQMALTGAIAFQVEDFIAKKEYGEALAALDKWDWEKPVERLEGFSPYLRARVFQAQGRSGRAAREFEAVAAVAPASAYAPRALLGAAKLRLAAGNSAAARAYLDRIVRDYQTSPEVDEAKKALAGLGR